MVERLWAMRRLVWALVLLPACIPPRVPAPPEALVPPSPPTTSSVASTGPGAASAPPTVRPPRNAGRWSYDVASTFQEPECEDDDADCEAIAHWTVTATDGDGTVRVVFEDKTTGWFDDAWGALDPIDGLEDSDVRALNFITDSGADFATRTLQTYLVRLHRDRAELEILYEGDGESSSEMDACIRYDVIGFRVASGGSEILVLHTTGTEYIDQGLNQPCEAESVLEEIVQTITLQPAPAG